MKKDNTALHILLVEDNPGDILLIKDYLQEAFTNPAITTATSYKEATKTLAIENNLFDVLLLDLRLPDSDGETLINDILKHEKIKCPVIILTGYADVNFSIQSISLGISDYLLKDELNAMMLYKSITYSIERWEYKLRILESEKKFSLLFSLSPQPRWLYDCESLQFLQVNEIALQHYGYSESDFLQMSPVQLYPLKYRTEAERTIRCADKEGLSLSGLHTHVKRNGEEIDVDIYSHLLWIDGKSCRSVLAIDVTEKNKAELKLTQAIIKAQEEERYAIGSELHDNICQILTGSMLSLASVKSGLTTDKVPVFNQGIDSIKLAAQEIRLLSHRLAPAFFADMNLKDSISNLLSSVQVAGRFTPHIHFDAALDNINLKREFQINLYRILQEQLNNIIKYAGASVIEANLLLRSGNLIFKIADNGAGFDESRISKGIGFANMKRRAELFYGDFKVISAPGEGCVVLISIPEEHVVEA